MNRLWLRITFSFLMLMSLLLLISGFFLADMMKNTYYDLKENQLRQTGQLVLNAVELEEEGLVTNPLQHQIAFLSKTITPRITVIDEEGRVLADSEDEPLEMENHSNRPEIKQILQEKKESGIAIRHSETLGFDMMYVTIPIDENSGVMRTALSLEPIQQAIHKLWIGLAVVLFTAWLCTGLIGMRLARNISSPIEEMIQVSERLKEKDYLAKVKQKPKGELGQLAKSINVLATSLKSQMEKIEENEQRLSGVLTNMVNGVLLVNTEGRISLANRAMGDILGEDPKQFIGKLHMEVVRNVELNRLIDECLQLRTEIREEIHLLYPKDRTIDAHLAPYVGETGKIKGIIAVLHDVTDIRRLEKMRSQFVANVSHELKTPITSVKGFAETLLDGAMEDDELCRSFLKIIHDESNRIHRLINDLLYLSSIEHHQIPLSIENVNLTSAVQEITETLREKTAKKKLLISFDQKKDVWIEGEKDRIQQIIINLLSNAISYTPEDGKIMIAIQERKNNVELKITDTGIGISQNDLPRIFERFYRVDKARSRSSGGTGLGLAIVKHLVESHHGTIDVKSVEGEGTTFVVTFPIKQKKNR